MPRNQAGGFSAHSPGDTGVMHSDSMKSVDVETADSRLLGQEEGHIPKADTGTSGCV